MAGGYQLSHDAVISMINTTDIGGTSASLGTWLDMSGFESCFVYVEVGTWNSGDDLDECRIEAASDSSGSNNVEVTTDAASGNYDTGAPIDADGNWVIIEIRNEDLPEGKPFVNFVLGEGGNTGVDNITAFMILYNAKEKYSERNAAAIAGEKVYVTPHT